MRVMFGFLSAGTIPVESGMAIVGSAGKALVSPWFGCELGPGKRLPGAERSIGRRLLRRRVSARRSVDVEADKAAIYYVRPAGLDTDPYSQPLRPPATRGRQPMLQIGGENRVRSSITARKKTPPPACRCRSRDGLHNPRASRE